MECFLCNLLCENTNFREKREEVKKFTKNIWLSCKTFLSARKHHQHKYGDVVSPENWSDDVIGYHSSCYKEFRVKSKYLSYESDVWCNAHMRCLTEKLPENYGWPIIDGKYHYYWYDGPQSPSFQKLSSATLDSDITDEEIETDEDDSAVRCEDFSDASDED